MIVAGSFGFKTCRGVLLLSALLALLRIDSAAAHAELIESNPPPGSVLAEFPAEIRLSFTEAVDPSLSSLFLFSPDDSPVELAAVASAPGNTRELIAPVLASTSIAYGAYTVVWNAYSAEDDHTSSGTLSFSVGTGIAPDQGSHTTTRVGSAAIVGKWLELIGTILITGLALFRTLARSSFSIDFEKRIDPFIVLALVGFVGAITSLRAREVASSSGEFLGPVDGTTVAGLLESTYGGWWIVRASGLLCVLFLSVWSRKHGNRDISPAIAVFGAITMATIALSGHAGSVQPSWAATVIDFLHMAGAGIWLGGLLGLLLVVDPAPGSKPYLELTRAQGSRFALAVACIALSGMLSAWWQIGGRRGLTGSDYGRTLLVKMVVVAVILGVAYYNRRVLQRSQTRLHWISLAIGLELALALLVLLLSADLSQIPPANRPLPVQIAARAIEVDASSSREGSTMAVSGVLTGDTSDLIAISVDPAFDLQRVIVRASLTDEQTGTVIGNRFDADPLAGEAGHYQFVAGRLGRAGDWQLEITVRRAGLPDVVAPISIDTSGLDQRSSSLAADEWGGFRPTLHTALALGLAVVMLLVGLAGLDRITGFEPLASGFLLAASLLIAGGFLVSAARAIVPITPDHNRSSPISPDPATLVYAGELYRQNCAACHGADGAGTGDGNLAHLHGNAADLTTGVTVQQSDGDLRYWIAHGVAGSEMPAFSPALSEEEQWQLVFHIRELQEAAQATIEAEE